MIDRDFKPTFLSFDAKATNTEPHWIFKGLKPRTVGMISATGGTGKSLFCQNLCMAVSMGIDPWGIGIRNAGPSLYLNFEDDSEDMTNRGNSIARYGLTDFDWEQTSCFIASMFGMELELIDKNGDRNENDIAWLREQCEGMRMVILDPLSHLHNGDENNASHMKTLMVILKKIAKDCECGIFVCQHTNKAAALNGTADKAEAAKGSITINNTARLNITLTGDGDDSLKLHYAKVNGCKAPQDIYLRRGAEGVLIRDIDKTNSACCEKNAGQSQMNQHATATTKFASKSIQTSLDIKDPVDWVHDRPGIKRRGRNTNAAQK